MLMTARMTSPAFAVDGAMDALNAVAKTISRARVPVSRELVHLRASQINGCSVCVDMHAKAARRSGESEERVFAVAAWRETPYFTDAERAALALTESLTRPCQGPLAGRPPPHHPRVHPRKPPQHRHPAGRWRARRLRHPLGASAVR